MKNLLSMVLAGVCLSLFGAKAAQGPIRVSLNGRYFVDAQGEPFYFLADTHWELFRRYSLSDAQSILENRKAKGFSVVMVMLTGVGSGTGPNLEGQHPWLNDNPARPNLNYFTNVDAVVKQAQANDIHLLREKESMRLFDNSRENGFPNDVSSPRATESPRLVK